MINILMGRYINIFVSTWVLLVAGLVFLLPMIYLRVKEHTDLGDEAMSVVFILLCSNDPKDFLSARMDDEGHIKPVIESNES
jgi:hypothetical protein